MQPAFAELPKIKPGGSGTTLCKPTTRGDYLASVPEHDFELGCVRLLGEASDYDCSFSEPIMYGKSVSHVKRTDERRRLCYFSYL